MCVSIVFAKAYLLLISSETVVITHLHSIFLTLSLSLSLSHTLSLSLSLSLTHSLSVVAAAVLVHKHVALTFRVTMVANVPTAYSYSARLTGRRGSFKSIIVSP